MFSFFINVVSFQLLVNGFCSEGVDAIAGAASPAEPDTSTLGAADFRDFLVLEHPKADEAVGDARLALFVRAFVVINALRHCSSSKRFCALASSRAFLATSLFSFRIENNFSLFFNRQFTQ